VGDTQFVILFLSRLGRLLSASNPLNREKQNG
jgi:hypothetical protein